MELTREIFIGFAVVGFVFSIIISIKYDTLQKNFQQIWEFNESLLEYKTCLEHHLFTDLGYTPEKIRAIIIESQVKSAVRRMIETVTAIEKAKVDADNKKREKVG